MSVLLAEATVAVKTDVSKVGDNAESDLKKKSGLFARMGEITGGVLAAGLIQKGVEGIGILFSRAIEYGKQSIENSSDLNEAATAVSAVFGTAYESIDTWASGAATALGQSKLQALDAAKGFGVYGRQAGLTAKENAAFSQGLVETASDLASFHNADPSEVIEALGAGLRGEAEPLRRFGILMSEDTLKAAALKAGITDTLRPLTQQEKILAANALVMQSVGVAAGDFAKTSDGLANQQRIFDANTTNLSATLGTVFLPLLQGSMAVANSFFPILQRGAVGLSTVVGPAIGKVAEKASELGGSIGTALDNFDFGKAVDTFKEVSPLFIVFDQLRPIFPQLLAAIQPLLPVAMSLAGALGGTLSRVLTESVVPAFASILESVAPLIPMLAESLGGAIVKLLPSVGDLLIALVPLLPPIVELAVMAMPLLTGAIDILVPVLQWLIEWVGGSTQVFSTFLSYLSGDVSAGGLIGALRSIEGPIGFVMRALNDFGRSIGVTFVRARSFVTSFTNGLTNGFKGVSRIVGETFSNVVNFVKNGINNVIRLVNNGIRALNRFKVTLPDALGGASIGLSIPTIPMLARGSNNAPDTFIAGERGPELITGARGATVRPYEATKDILAQGRGDVYIDKVVIDAESIDTIQKAREIFNGLRQTARAGVAITPTMG